MSTQKGNTRKSGPPKYQNKSTFKNVYHDTSKKTQNIVNTVVAGVCVRCKDIIDWKIKYKKYKPLTQPKTCVSCKQKCVKQAYVIHCIPCADEKKICAKCGEKKDVVVKPQPTEAELASEDRKLQFELEQLPERKRRTFLRLQEKGLLNSEDCAGATGDEDLGSDTGSDFDNKDEIDNDSDGDNNQENDTELHENDSDNLSEATLHCQPEDKCEAKS